MITIIKELVVWGLFTMIEYVLSITVFHGANWVAISIGYGCCLLIFGIRKLADWVEVQQ
jgi:hypothetical protein